MAWLSGWAKRIELTLDNTNVDDNLSNFPILIYLSASSGQGSDDVSAVFDELTQDANRKKIAVTTSDGTTQCYVEIERWDDASEKAWLWVKVPTVNSGSTTTLYLYYDSSQAENTTFVGDTIDAVVHNVWDSNFLAVFHMAQDPNGDGANAIKDSTNNQNDGTPGGTMLTEDLVDGKIGKAIEFDGSDDHIDLTNTASLNPTAAMTLEYVFNGIIDTTISGEWGISRDDNSLGRAYALGTSNSKICLQINGAATIRNQGGQQSLSDNIDYFIAAKGNSTIGWKAWLNHSEDGSAGWSAPNSTTGASRIANRTYSGAAGQAEGKVPEVRISDIARSDAWLKATYYSNWDDIITFGSEEISGVSAQPLTANFLLQASPLFSILTEPLIATASLLGPPLRPITAEPLVATTSLSGSPLELVSIAAEPLVGNFSLSSLFVVTYDVAAEPLIADTSLSGSFARSILAAPLTASFSMSASIKQFLVSTLSLILGIEIGSSLTLVNSLNLDIESQLRLLNNILTSLSGNRTFKLTIEELAQVKDELRLISHILDEDSGKTYGDFYFLKPHGIT